MKKILILGATGMAGHMIYFYLRELNRYILRSVCFRTKLEETSYILNVHDEKGLAAILQKEMPDIVINCIGILIKGSKESAENCIYINAYYPHVLSRLLHEIRPDAKLIHISTDCVFSGRKGQYTDSDVKDALDIYGMTKGLGEIINDKDITIRTSIIGPELKQNGEGLFHWVFSQRAKGSLNGFTRAVWSGVTTLELAKVIEKVIAADLIGLLQVSNNQIITKYQLILMIVNVFKLPISVNPIDGISIDKSILSSKKLTDIAIIPSYRDMINELYTFMVQHQNRYAIYIGDQNE